MKNLIRFISVLALAVLITSAALQWGNWRCWLWPNSIAGASEEVRANFTVKDPTVYVSQYDDTQEYADDSRAVIKPSGAAYQVEPIKQSEVEYTWQSSIMPTFNTCLAGEATGRQVLFWTALGSAAFIALVLLLKLVGALWKIGKRRHE